MTRAGRPMPDIAARADHAGQLLRAALGTWAQENFAALAAAEPEMPEGVHGRTAQIWQPLLAIADLIGEDDWPARARAACEELAMRDGVSDDAQIDALDELEAMFGGDGYEDDTSRRRRSHDLDDVAGRAAVARPGRTGKPAPGSTAPSAGYVTLIVVVADLLAQLASHVHRRRRDGDAALALVPAGPGARGGRRLRAGRIRSTPR